MCAGGSAKGEPIEVFFHTQVKQRGVTRIGIDFKRRPKARPLKGQRALGQQR